jgi:methane/ammonia monooxygenase subunit A
MSINYEAAGAVKATPDYTPEQKRITRAIELIMVPAAFLITIGSFHIHAMLTMGDWDFWLDWKDREFWITVTPVLIVTFPAAVHYGFWNYFRLPFGATFCVTALLIGEWIVRWFGWQNWSYFPIQMVTPAYFYAGALCLDAVLLLTRSWLLAAVLGAWLFGLTFYGSNYAWLAYFHVPVEANGLVTTIADLYGFEYIRTANPEYIRIVEHGTLRTFGQHSASVSTFFTGFMCVLMYWIWWSFGAFFANPRYIERI